jgi:site-specific recombinase XerD
MGENDLLLDAFLQHVRIEKGLAAKTVSAYAADLAPFLRHLAKEGLAIDAVKGPDLSAFLAARSRHGLSARSQPCAASSRTWWPRSSYARTRPSSWTHHDP